MIKVLCYLFYCKLGEKCSLSLAYLIPTCSHKDTRLCAAFTSTRLLASQPCLWSRFYGYEERELCGNSSKYFLSIVGQIPCQQSAPSSLCPHGGPPSYWNEPGGQGGQSHTKYVAGPESRTHLLHHHAVLPTGRMLSSFLTGYFAAECLCIYSVPWQGSASILLGNYKIPFSWQVLCWLLKRNLIYPDFGNVQLLNSYQAECERMCKNI